MLRTAGATTAVPSIPEALPSLPELLIVWEILARLPARDLLRCRAVCRSWRRLTSAADFLLAHHRRQPSLPLVSFGGEFVDAFDVRLPAVVRRPVLQTISYNPQNGFRLLASCDGLLLISSGRRFYICNSATRQWTALPRLSEFNVVGLYPHSSSGEYRILCWKGCSNFQNVAYYVLTVGSPAEPRCIGRPVPSQSDEKYIAAGLMLDGSHPPVLLHSFLHWALHSQPAKGILIFDTVVESFRSMCYPTGYSLGNYLTPPRLLEMDGTLGISWINNSKTMMKLCLLQDYETEIWLLKYQIALPMIEMSRFTHDFRFDGLVLSENGDVLVGCFNCFFLFHCDRNVKLLLKFGRDYVSKRVTGHWFKESLVRHEFFQSQHDDLESQPGFFQGLTKCRLV